MRRAAEPSNDWAIRRACVRAGFIGICRAAHLCELALARQEGQLSADGALVCLTGPHTGRSPRDKFIVREPSSDAHLWWGSVNRPLEESHFAALEHDVTDYLRGRDLFVQDLAGGADPGFRLPVRVVTELAWHSLFARNLLLDSGAANGQPFTIIAAPGFKASPARHGTRSETCIVISFARRRVIIAGTAYAGEIKKAIFTILNYLLPFRDVFPMHCSANLGADGRVALFFGLSGTGKTTLSSDPSRRLIGDDEHGWSGTGVFNFEGGCYAKTVRLSAKAEPQIWSATRRFGAVLENVVMDPESRRVDFDADSLTENTRAAFPIDFIDAHEPSGAGGHPTDVVMLTADAFGVMPPIARLTPSQAHVSLPLGLHGPRRWHRARRHRTGRDVQRVLWRAVPAAAPRRVRVVSGTTAGAAWIAGVAGEHRLDGRARGRRGAHAAPLHASDGHRGARGPARSGADQSRSDLRRRRAAQLSRRTRRAARSAVDVARAHVV